MTACRCKALGKWRLTKADQWDRAYLDLVEPAYIRFDEDGGGEMVFGALQAALECEAGVSIIFFDHHGDETQIKAHRW